MHYSISAYYNNAAGGAGEYAIPTVMVNGQPIAGNAFVCPRKAAIVRAAMISTVGTYLSLVRNGKNHANHGLVLPVLADTGADYEQALNFEEILGGKGIAVDANESIGIRGGYSGNGVAYVFLEIDTDVPGVDCTAFAVVGAAAMVAGTPVETGANLRAAALEPDQQYNLRSLYWYSTTAIRLSLGVNSGQTGGQLSDFRAHTALLIGHKMDIATSGQRSLLKGRGSDWTATSVIFASSTATDAPNTQHGFFIFSHGD